MLNEPLIYFVFNQSVRWSSLFLTFSKFFCDAITVKIMCVDSETEVCEKVSSQAAVSSDNPWACSARTSATVGICTT